MEVEVFEDTGRVVVKGSNASAGEIQRQLYYKPGLRAAVVSRLQVAKQAQLICTELGPIAGSWAWPIL